MWGELNDNGERVDAFDMAAQVAALCVSSRKYLIVASRSASGGRIAQAQPLSRLLCICQDGTGGLTMSR